MGASQTSTNTAPQTQQNPVTVRDILDDAFPGLVTDTAFRIEKDGEEICYWGFKNLSKQSNGLYAYFIQNTQISKFRSLIQLLNCAQAGKKGFCFVCLDAYPDWLFSLEIEDFDSNSGFVSLAPEAEVKRKLTAQPPESIIRFPPPNSRNNNKVYMVAIKIGSAGSRDYTPLRHYIVSSDNRTYNKIDRNGTEFFAVSQITTPPKNSSALPHNLLVSGAPGTGKSFFLKKESLEAGKNVIQEKMNAGKSEEQAKAEYAAKYIKRVTFYEDYSYESFVGCYKPVPAPVEAEIEYDGKNGRVTENKITYQFVSGPFIDTYIAAKNDPGHNYFLIIEEINRAKAAGVFGDMFQLLDRKKGVSEYDVTPDAALGDYLEENGCARAMRLPANMYIWATMNSADQGVLPLDSAFKRRWASKYMDINNAGGMSYELILPTKNGGSTSTVLWENLRVRINQVILQKGFDEDRCIGAWYFSEEEIGQINAYYTTTTNRDELVNPLIDKLFYYLRQDVFRRDPPTMFRDNAGDGTGLSMSAIRNRVRQGDAIDSILNIDALPVEPQQNSAAPAPQNGAAPAAAQNSAASAPQNGAAPAPQNSAASAAQNSAPAAPQNGASPAAP